MVPEKCVSREWVLLRGLAREQGHWGPFKELLKQAEPHSQVTCIDLPGCGAYHRLSCPHKVSAIAEFVQSHLKGPRPQQRILVAISLGGMIATELVRQNPTGFDGLVIINSSFKNLSPFYHRLQIRAWQHLFKAIIAKNEYDKELAIAHMVSSRADKEQLALDWTMIAQDRPVSPINFMKQLVAAARYEAPTEPLGVPTLVMTSDGDQMVHPDCSRKIAQTWNAPLEVHPSAGHELCLDAPDWVIEKIKAHF